MGRDCRYSMALVLLLLVGVTGCVTSSSPLAVGSVSEPSGQYTRQFTSSANRKSSGPAIGSSPSPYDRMTDVLTNNPVTDTVSSLFRRGSQFAKTSLYQPTMSRNLTPIDPLSLSYKSKPSGPDLYLSMARLSECGGNMEQAATQYQKALDLDADNLDALLGFAHLRDRQSRFDEAIELYRQATVSHPNHAGAHNDLGLGYGRSGRLEESVEALTRAVELSPERKLFRNNLATVMTELGQIDQALAHLSSAHGPAIAHYNLGFLLHRRDQDLKASEHFSEALRVDPSMTEAQSWLAKLGNPTPTPSESPAPTIVITDGAESEGDSAIAGAMPPQPSTGYPTSDYRPSWSKSQQHNRDDSLTGPWSMAVPPAQTEVPNPPPWEEMPPTPDQAVQDRTAAPNQDSEFPTQLPTYRLPERNQYPETSAVPPKPDPVNPYRNSSAAVPNLPTGPYSY